MSWKKMGRIHSLSISDSVTDTHMQVPTVLVKDDRLRVYYAARHTTGQSFTAYIDLDINDFTRVLDLRHEAVLKPGKVGTFDDEGIMPSDIVQQGDQLWMYYSGWNRRLTIPYHNATGLAVSHDGGKSFERMFDGPILDRIATEPYLAVTPCIIKDNGHWKMWYVSGLKWVEIDQHFEPVYVIKSAQSEDGINWQRSGQIAIPQNHDLEAFSRPCVIKKDGVYCMWYCYRKSHDYRDGQGSYRMGYAESMDAINWQRMDHKSGIDVSSNFNHWDSKMIAYPYVAKVKGSLYLFYNGNGFGQSGFGYAKWQD